MIIIRFIDIYFIVGKFYFANEMKKYFDINELEKLNIREEKLKRILK